MQSSAIVRPMHSRRSGGWFVAAVITVSLTTLTSAAHAQQRGERAADLAFEQGRTMLAQGKLVEACSKFAESDRLSPSGRAVLNLAECYERRGMLASAYAKFLEVAIRAVEARRPDAERHARERAARLEPRLPRLGFAVPKESDAPGLTVKLDGQILERSAFGTVEPIDPGTPHTYEATADGGKTFTATVTPEEGQTTRVELRWSTSASSVQTKAGDGERKDDRASSGASAESARPFAYAALGLGLVGVGVGAYAGWQVLEAKSAVDSHCDTQRTCDPQGLDAASRGSTFSVVSPIAFGVGALGLGIGGYLLLRRESAPGRVALIPSVDGRGAGVAAHGQF